MEIHRVILKIIATAIFLLGLVEYFQLPKWITGNFIFTVSYLIFEIGIMMFAFFL